MVVRCRTGFVDNFLTKLTVFLKRLTTTCLFHKIQKTPRSEEVNPSVKSKSVTVTVVTIKKCVISSLINIL